MGAHTGRGSQKDVPPSVGLTERLWHGCQVSGERLVSPQHLMVGDIVLSASANVAVTGG